MTAKRWKVLQAALAKARDWRRRKGVVGIGIGQRHRKGRWVRGPACIVVKVIFKYELGSTQLRKPLPRWIVVRQGGRSHRVGVDIQETRQAVGVVHGIVAKPVDDSNQAIGSVSAVVRGGGQRYVLIAGHVGKEGGRDLSVGGVAGTTQDPIMTSTMDYCLVDSTQALPVDAPLLPGNHQINGVAPVSELEIDQTVYFHHTATGTRIPTVLRHVDMSAPFSYPAGTTQMEGLLVTDGVTVPGDSGALLYDAGFHAVGTVIGMFGGESYFVPCERLDSLALEIC